MKKFEVIVDDTNGEELASLLRTLPYVKQIKESKATIDPYSLASESSLAEDWLSEEDDEFQKLYHK